MCEVVAAIRLSKRALLDVSRYTCSGVQRARGRERGTRGRERERGVETEDACERGRPGLCGGNIPPLFYFKAASVDSSPGFFSSE